MAFASAALIALLITPLVRRLAIRLDNVDLPSPPGQQATDPARRRHRRGELILVAIGILVANDRLPS